MTGSTARPGATGAGCPGGPSPSSVNWLIRQRCANGIFHVLSGQPSDPLQCSQCNHLLRTGHELDGPGGGGLSNAVRRHGEAGPGGQVARQPPESRRRVGLPQPGGCDGRQLHRTGRDGLRAHGISPAVVRSSRDGYQALSALQSACSAAPADRGGIAFQTGGPRMSWASGTSLPGTRGDGAAAAQRRGRAAGELADRRLRAG